MPSNIIAAINQEGKIVHIDEVSSGLNCNCTCPECKSKLVAKKGQKKQHHFAHHNATECKYSPETAIHILAKEIIKKHNRIILEDKSYFNFTQVDDEVYIDDIKADVFAKNGNKELIIEVFVTHRIDRKKMAKLKKINIPTLEIDLSKVSKIADNISREDFERMVIDDHSNRKYFSWKEKARTIEDNIIYLKTLNKQKNKSNVFKTFASILIFLGFIISFFSNKKR